VSVNGGAWPKWRSDGKELYYLAPDRMLMASSVATSEAGLTFAAPLALFERPGVNPDTLARSSLRQRMARGFCSTRASPIQPRPV
jgi:hypothetical protein